MTLVSELELRSFDYTDPSLCGERFHKAMRELRAEGWLASGVARCGGGSDVPACGKLRLSGDGTAWIWTLGGGPEATRDRHVDDATKNDEGGMDGGPGEPRAGVEREGGRVSRVLV
jgi:hypothetical protein